MPNDGFRPTLQSAGELHAIAYQLRQAIAHGSPEVVKQFLGELIDRVEIGLDKRTQPYFWVPRLQQPDYSSDQEWRDSGSYSVKPVEKTLSYSNPAELRGRPDVL